MNIFKLLCIIFKKIFIFFLTILAISGTIVIFPFLIPIYIYRYIVIFCAKIFRSDLKKILSTRSAIFAVDDLYNQPRSPLIVGIFFERNICLEYGRKYFMETLVQSRKITGELVRPELTHYIYRWMGFYFWKKDEDFNMENHLYDYNGQFYSEAYDELDLYKITNELVVKPFIKGRSPWEFLLVHNCKKDLNDENEISTTLLMFRVHHALADGYSILRLISELMRTEGTFEPILPKYPKIPMWKKIMYTLAYPIYAPFEIIESSLEAYDSNEWHIPEKKLTRITHGAVHDKISVEFIKEIKNAYGVSFTSVILAAFTGGMRNFMLEQCVKVPKSIHCLTPLPMPGHSRQLRNFMTMCYITLPVGMSDPQQRLKTINKQLFKLRKSTVPTFFFHLIPFMGGLLPFMTKFLARQILVTAVTSNFPGPAAKTTYLGNPVTDIMFSGGMLPGNIGLGITSISYNGYIRIAAGMDESIVPENMTVKSLIDKVAQEFDVLKNEATV